MKVLVTGGMGFIGRYVVENLLSKGYQPIIFDHHKRLAKEYLEDVDVFLGDVRDHTAVTEAMAHVDSWIHLAAVLGTQETIKDPRPAAESNLIGGLNMLESAAKYNLPGTYIAVGNWWMDNPYSITKNMIERFVAMYNKDRGTKVNIVRAVNAYGPRQLAAAPFGPGKVRKITPAFICRALSKQPIEVYGDGTQISDMVYVGDVAEALVRSLEHAIHDHILEKPVEIGSVEHHTVNEIAALINKLTGNNQPVRHLPMRPGEIAGAEVTADTTTLAMIGMDSDNLMPLNIGMRETIKYFKESEGHAWNKSYGVSNNGL